MISRALLTTFRSARTPNLLLRTGQREINFNATNILLRNAQRAFSINAARNNIPNETEMDQKVFELSERYKNMPPGSQIGSFYDTVDPDVYDAFYRLNNFTEPY